MKILFIGSVMCHSIHTEILNTENQGTFILQNLYQSRESDKSRDFSFQHLSHSVGTSIFSITFQNFSFFLYPTKVKTAFSTFTMETYHKNFLEKHPV